MRNILIEMATDLQSNKDTNSRETKIVVSHDIHIDDNYASWIAQISHRYRMAQVKATIRVNAEKLLFNWQLGRDLVVKKAEERWGTGVVEQLSLDLQREFPGEKGFSTSNLWYMKKWYLFYASLLTDKKLQQLVGELQESVNKASIKLQRHIGELDSDGKRYTNEVQFPLPFALVPWGQHIEIITRCSSVEEAIFYIHQVFENGLSRNALINSIKANLYAHKGKLVNNFSEQLPVLQSQLVQEVLKENYDFGFATVNQEIYNESELENALTSDVTSLLLEMGTGFAFIGRQKELLVEGRSRKIDLLFYHIRLRCYIACEIKVKPFEPEFVGKLNFYVNAVDELLKSDDENPTIGLLICSDMNKTEVQWSFRGVNTPMGVATYNNIRIKDALPTREQLKERIDVLKKKLHEANQLLSKKSLESSD